MHLAYQAAFLILLATGRRVSEVHSLSALDTDVSFEPDGSVSLQFLPEFLAKNQSPGFVSPSLTFPLYKRILSPGDDDRLLCPVRVLRAYRRHSAPLRGQHARRLF